MVTSNAPVVHGVSDMVSPSWPLNSSCRNDLNPSANFLYPQPPQNWMCTGSGTAEGSRGVSDGDTVGSGAMLTEEMKDGAGVCVTAGWLLG